MYKDLLTNINIEDIKTLKSPSELKKKLPLDMQMQKFILDSRKVVADIVRGRDKRFLVITGPCSIHDIEAAKEYGKRLLKLSSQMSDYIFPVMRVYFEKPRTSVGWKGLINDPRLDGSFDMEEGLMLARNLLLDLTKTGIPLATEALDPISPQYLADLFSWISIGARTSESQTHRELASGLSMPVGFKNGTGGGLDMAINAIKAAAGKHRFMGVNQEGMASIIHTAGNPNGHLILRGGKEANYNSASVGTCEALMEKAQVAKSIVIDCSHANSNKDFLRQIEVAKDVAEQVSKGNKSIKGIMLESYLNQGNQSSELPPEEMKYGVSITDACISWEDTEELLKFMHKVLAEPLEKRHSLNTD